MNLFLSEILAGALAIFFLLIIFKMPSKKEEQQEIQKQILSVFVPGEKMWVQQIGDRLRERTGRRKDLSDAALYNHLDALVDQKRLLKTRTPVSFSNGDILHKVEYSLPEESV